MKKALLSILALLYTLPNIAADSTTTNAETEAHEFVQRYLSHLCHEKFDIKTIPSCNLISFAALYRIIKIHDECFRSPAISLPADTALCLSAYLASFDDYLEKAKKQCAALIDCAALHAKINNIEREISEGILELHQLELPPATKLRQKKYQALTNYLICLNDTKATHLVVLDKLYEKFTIDLENSAKAPEIPQEIKFLL